MQASITSLKTRSSSTESSAVAGAERLMTAGQVAARLGVPLSWVYEKSALGIIPSIKVGVYRRFRWSHIEQWLEEANA
jgi:excisionase family DNA binding protein